MSISKEQLRELETTMLKDLPDGDEVWANRHPYGLPGWWGLPKTKPFPWYKRQYFRIKQYWSRMFYAIKSAHRDELDQW